MTFADDIKAGSRRHKNVQDVIDRFNAAAQPLFEQTPSFVRAQSNFAQFVVDNDMANGWPKTVEGDDVSDWLEYFFGEASSHHNTYKECGNHLRNGR
jgi:hypothetical protein